MPSYPLRVRRLKHLQTIVSSFGHVVSFTGTWIETRFRCDTVPEGSSYPLRVRGLKLPVEIVIICNPGSYPLRVRGLKPGLHPLSVLLWVSYPLRVRGLKPLLDCIPEVLSSRILYGYVDWNSADRTVREIVGWSYPLRVRGLKLSWSSTWA